MHLCYELVFDGRLHLSPITSHPQNVLDIGTGRGDWAIDFAEYVLFTYKEYLHGVSSLFFVCRAYPSARVIGTDLSPIQPLWYEITNYLPSPDFFSHRTKTRY
jgi:methylase of polypeptide subunit release factors